jgi:hypothetical protein
MVERTMRAWTASSAVRFVSSALPAGHRVRLLDDPIYGDAQCGAKDRLRSALGV